MNGVKKYENLSQVLAWTIINEYGAEGTKFRNLQLLDKDKT